MIQAQLPCWALWLNISKNLAFRSCVLKFIWEGRLKPIVYEILPLSKVQKVHQILEEEGTHFGRLL